MNKQDIKFCAKRETARLKKSLLRAIAAFPPETVGIWDDRHIHIAMKVLIDNPEITTQAVIKNIKIADQSSLRGTWSQDIGDNYTFQDEVEK